MRSPLAIAKSLVVLAVTAAMAAVTMCASAQDEEIVKVKGRGVGSDKTSALKDAYRDAVERAVGLYIDAEQMMKNETMVKDQILTHSNAYIESCKLAKEESSTNGIVTVTILANVRKQALMKKIDGIMPSQKIDLSGVAQDLHAQIVTETKSSEDALSLLKNELDGFHPVKQLMKVTLGTTKPVVERVEGDPSLVRLWYPVNVTVDNAKYYNEFVPRIERVLEQIKTAPANRLDLANDVSFIKKYNEVIAEKFGSSRINRTGIMTKSDDERRDGLIYDSLYKYGCALNEEYKGMTFLRTRILGKEYLLEGLDFMRGIHDKPYLIARRP